MDWIAAVNLIAIVAGPILAVVVTRLMDNRTHARARRYQVFRDLMRTRSAKLSHEHVDALNLVEIEFDQFPAVKAAWQKYMDNLSARFPATDAEQSQLILRRDQLFIKLIQELANNIGLKSVDITDVMTSNYYPVGWQSQEAEQQQVRQLLIQVLSGSKPLAVRMTDLSKWNGPFPPLVPPPPSATPPAPLSTPK